MNSSLSLIKPESEPYCYSIIIHHLCLVSQKSKYEQDYSDLSTCHPSIFLQFQNIDEQLLVMLLRVAVLNVSDEQFQAYSIILTFMSYETEIF